jgi:hypothetical protein
MRFLDGQRTLVNMWMLTTHWEQHSVPVGVDIDPDRLKQRSIDAYNRTHGTSIPVLEHGIHLELDNDLLLAGLTDGSVFRPDEVVREGRAFDVSQRKIIRAGIMGGLELLRLLDPGLEAFVTLNTATIACVRVKRWRGGSASHLPGLTVMTPQPNWTVANYASCLLHETIHQSLFLEDRARGLFTRGIDWQARELQVYSAIRRTRRPLDMTIHAACVAVGLMYFYHLCGAPDREQVNLRQLRRSMADITKTERRLREKGRVYLTEDGYALLEDLRAFCAEPQYDEIARALRAPSDGIAQAGEMSDGLGRELARA